ncbi:MAG: UDP-glucose 4-epimerase GalE [Phenylobacterium sp.]|uniref:UDP-glucose 4-epimerase GalE n=1 Tax=Phenylobacterium sp. TaxID=1871053 RepID=UPI0025DB9564|nr:UDP-glucose 4-epimerase GalE [Phenylobacterium sp.]MBI1200792.1 UDP-glucose 4-epimerase GalE [Phenylobacterium sp.]
MAPQDAQPAVLITGGAGYVGAHAAKAFAEAGWRPVVFDNLSVGHRAAVQWGPLVQGDVRDRCALREAMTTHQVSAVVHFAGASEVGRSWRDPADFWAQNLEGTAGVLDAMRASEVRRLVFSSSAAVYGDGAEVFAETSPTQPLNPYGETKLAAERMIAAYARAYGLSALCLRYFNAAGADPGGRIGESRPAETHLIPLALSAALGGSPPLAVFGDDYATPDGTCVRDYVHVDDLAEAHVAAVASPLDTGACLPLNLGSGRGVSVREVIGTVARELGRPVPHRVQARRAGDPARLVADARRANDVLRWRARRSDITTIVRHAAAWALRRGY